MAEAGALAIEWSVLDAQYFGIPQRRRRVFVIAIFDPVLAERCPSPLLPVAESLPGHLAKGKPKRKSVATTLTESTGTDGGIVNASGASLYHKSTVVNQDVNAGHLVTEGAILGSDIVGSLNTSDSKMISSQYVNENKCVVEPYVKSSRAQTSEDSETWIPGEVNQTLNSFDVGDTRATTAIVEPVLFKNSYRDGARIASDGVTQTLTSKMGTGGGNTPMIAYGLQGTMIGRQDHNGPVGTGVSKEDGPMYTLTKTDVHAVAYDEKITSPTLTAYNMDSRSPQSEEQQRIVNAVFETTMAVRRLTPLECERLMGWPDDHTRYKADGTEQADTHRYKQCGNGVASPVAQWIAKHILNI